MENHVNFMTTNIDEKRLVQSFVSKVLILQLYENKTFNLDHLPFELSKKMNEKKVFRTEKLTGQAVHKNWCEKANLSNLEK